MINEVTLKFMIFLLILKPKFLLWQFYLFTRQNITRIDFCLFSRTRGKAFFKYMYKCIKISLFLSLYPPPPPSRKWFCSKTDHFVYNSLSWLCSIRSYQNRREKTSLININFCQIGYFRARRYKCKDQ